MTEASFWRRLPAPAFRGFTGTGFGLRPAASTSAFSASVRSTSRSKAATGR